MGTREKKRDLIIKTSKKGGAKTGLPLERELRKNNIAIDTTLAEYPQRLRCKKGGEKGECSKKLSKEVEAETSWEVRKLKKTFFTNQQQKKKTNPPQKRKAKTLILLTSAQ